MFRSRRLTTTMTRAALRATGLALVLLALAAPAQAQVVCSPVPEIDPSSILSALTLLGGGLMLLTDRRHRAC